MRRPALTLLCLAGLTLFLGLGRQAITDADEGFYAEAAREMVETGDWLTPRFNYEDRWQKPVLYYWLTATTYLLSGPTEWAARLWSALSGLGLVFLTWAAARQRRGSSDASWLAGAIVATSFGAFALARMALPDLPLAFCITWAVWAGLNRRLTALGTAAALGFLLKGPVAVVLPGLVLLPLWYRQRVWRVLRLGEIARAAMVFGVIALPWYAAMTMQHGAAYLESFFLSDNLARFATDRFNEPRPWWFYVPIVVGGLLPWSAYLVVMPWRALVGWARRRWRPDGDEWALLLWATIPILFYTLSIGKQPRYILPALPPLAILMAEALTRRIARSSLDPADSKELRLATLMTAGLYAAFAVLLYRSGPLLVNAYPALTVLGVVAVAATALLLAATAVLRYWRGLPRILAAAAATLLLALQFGALSGVRPEAVEDMAALIHEQRLAGEEVGQYQVFVRNLAFYTGIQHADLYDQARALEFIASPQRVLLVVGRADLRALETAAGVHLARLGEVQYLNTANLRLRSLLRPDPSVELETVLLVANR